MTDINLPSPDEIERPQLSFRDLDLIEPIQESLDEAGYESPTPIQAAIIPHILNGADVLGQAQTGTGKTAAFALPLLSKIDLTKTETQVLVLAPTRELAIQVADSFKRYAKCLKGFRVAPIYGGQSYVTQNNQLHRGLHVVVGTPGRVMDHMRQGSLKIDMLRCLVLDEADEMLRMGFVDDVQWILSHTPENRQIALFSATMPPPIRKIADEHLKNPQVVTIDAQQRTAETIRQRFLILPHREKYDALTRILESEEIDGVIIFVKTKVGTVELADALRESGYLSVALNGDVPQTQRERAIDQLKSGAINIIVATDVAARGLDVQRISHVINYDLPFDTEAYVHRIGRTGRAGRSGEAILFVAPSQRGFLRVIERGTSQRLEEMPIPSGKSISELRVKRFKDRITTALNSPALAYYSDLIQEFINESQELPIQVAAALASILNGDRTLMVEEPKRNSDSRRESSFSSDRNRDRPRDSDRGRDADRGRERAPRGSVGRDLFRIEVGFNHGVKPANIVGAIANEAGLNSSEIGEIQIMDEFSTVSLPAGMPRDIFRVLGRAWVVGRQLRISKLSDHPDFKGENAGFETERKPRESRSREPRSRDGNPQEPKSREPKAVDARPSEGKRREKTKSEPMDKNHSKHDATTPAPRKPKPPKPALESNEENAGKPAFVEKITEKNDSGDRNIDPQTLALIEASLEPIKKKKAKKATS